MSIVRELVTKLKFAADLPAVRKFDKAVTGLGGKIRNVETKAQRFHAAIGAVGGGIVAATAVIGVMAGAVAGLTGAFTSVADKMRGFSARLELVTGNAKVAKQSFKALSQQAKATGSSLGITIDTFQRLSMSREVLGASNNEILKLTGLVQKLGVVSGASQEAQANALLQFGQAMSGGVVRAEEFNSIVENMPALAKAIAKGMNIPFGNLRQAMLDGQLTSEAVFNALIGQSEQVDKQFAKMPMTFARLRNAWSISFDEGIKWLEATVSFNDRLFGSLGRVGASLASLVKRNKDLIATGLDVFLNVLEEGFRAMGRAIRFVEDAIETLRAHPIISGTVLTVLGVVLAGIGATLTAMVIPAIWGAVTATWGFTAALLANPITWWTAGIMAVVAAVVLAIQHWDTIKSVVSNTIDVIRSKIAQFASAVSSLIPSWMRDLLGGRVKLPSFGGAPSQAQAQSQAAGGGGGNRSLQANTTITNNFAAGASSSAVSGLTGNALTGAIRSGLTALETV